MTVQCDSSNFYSLILNRHQNLFPECLRDSCSGETFSNINSGERTRHRDIQESADRFDMKELVLSVLSRGYSHVVQKDSKRQYGRLEVCFEPEDYFIWKSQPLLLRLSRSGRLLSGVEQTPPKTYSTRKGPLILYSEDFASSFPQPYKVNRKEQTFRASRQEAEFEFCSLRDLTEATLVYFKKQAKMECHSSITQHMLPDPKPGPKHVQAHHRPGDEHSYPNQTTGEGNAGIQAFFKRQGNCLYPRPEQVRYQPRFLCFPRPYRRPPGPLPLITPCSALRRSGDRPHMEAATCKPADTEEFSITGDRKTSLRTELVTPKAQISPIPEFDAQEKHTAQPEDFTAVAEHLTDYPKELNGQWKQNAIETGGEKGEHAPRPAYTNLFLGCSHLSKVPNERRQAEGGWRSRPVKRSDLHLPPIKQALPADTKSKDHGLKAENKTSQKSHKEPILRLPDIHQPEIGPEAAALEPPMRSVLKKVLVLLPGPLEQDGLSCLPEEKEDIEDVLCSNVGYSEVESIRKEEIRPIEHEYRFKAAQQDNLIRFEPEEDKEQWTNMGSMPPFISRRGLGKQCSMARYRQDQRDSADQSEPQPAIIRGSIPLELRECQKEGLLGTLIMGPAGEIICLSFWDSLADTEDHPDLEDAIREHVVRVMSSEGVLEELWTISDQIEEQAKQTGEMNDREVKAKHGHQKQTSTKSEACVPEQIIEKINNCSENELYSRGDDIMQQTGERMQRPQPKAKRRSGSSPRPESNSLTQKTAVFTPTAADEHIDKTKSKSAVNSKKPGKLDTEDDVHKGNVDKQKFERHASGDTYISNAENPGKTNKDKVDVESQDTSVSEETAYVPTRKKNRNAAIEKAKSTKSQITTEKVKKKSKGQAAFVVGKPRQSQEVLQNEKRNYSSERRKKTNRLLNESENKSTDNHSRSSSECNTDHMESSETSTPKKNQESGHSADIDKNYVHHEKNVVGHSLESERVAVSREDDEAEETGQVSINDFHKSNLSAVSSRSHTAKSSSTSTWSVRRSSVSSDTGVYSPVQLNLFPRRGGPTHHSASNPDKSESAAEAKSSAKAINQRESRLAAALAAKAERHRMEVEKKRKEKEEEKEEMRKRQEDREQTEERMRLELEEERSQRTQQARLRKLKEEEEKQRQAEREKEGQKNEQEDMERERRRQEETRNKKRYQERLQKERQEQEIRRAVELKRQHEEEKSRKEEEYRKWQKMDESERQEYLCRQREEEEEMRRAAEEKRRAKEEMDMWYEEFKRQTAALEQNLHFHRGLFVETEGLKQKQTISRPWVFSYFTKLGLATCNMYEE
ncbi:hypothetical protein Baya_5588 [Bagarius yarrelli]|uniref:Uncharacterized protein n=1 Tax=Bagarius yarrelli TaxID=175774 RepID=A0A556TW34_BAGYA|nr:hypothetical protein Baya_5588 [Bagarius yarrelli]